MNNHQINHNTRADDHPVLGAKADCAAVDTASTVRVVETAPPPLLGCSVPAGFPSPADDFIEEYLDLNQLLVKHREATFFVRVSGCSMTGAGIYSGDILIVDRSLEPAHGRIVIAAVDGELTVKRLIIHNGQVILRSENPDYPDIFPGDELRVWGVVTSVIHKV